MINRISLADCLDQAVPPPRVLDISVLDDTVWVRICDASENSRTEKHHEVAEISVSLPSLIEALNLLALDAERERLRPCDNPVTGSHETRIAGRRFTAVPVAPFSFVAAATDHLRYAPGPQEAKAPEGAESPP